MNLLAHTEGTFDVEFEVNHFIAGTSRLMAFLYIGQSILPNLNMDYMTGV